MKELEDKSEQLGVSKLQLMENAGRGTYKIVKEKFPDRGPSLVGYKVEFEPEKGSFQIRLLDVSGKVISGSVRELRAIRVGNPIELYLTSVVLPLAVGIPIFIWRRKKLK